MSFSNADVQTFLTVLTLVATTGGWLFDRYVVRRRRLSYRVHWNRPVDFTTPQGAQEMNLSIGRDGAVVTDPSFVVLRVENVGSFDIAADDVTEPLEFSFGGRRIVHYEVQETDPPGLRDAIRLPGGSPTRGPELVTYHPGDPDETPAGTLRLPRFAISRKARFKVLFLLSGEGREVSARARLSGGEIVTEGRRGARSRWGLALGGTSLLLGGLLVGLVVTREPETSQVACPAPGPVSITGSTALAPAIAEIARQYRALCSGSQIQVSASGTNIALEQLVAAGEADRQTNSIGAQRVKLAMADEYAGKPAMNTDLGYWPVGVGVFAMIVNKDTGISNLPSAAIQKLFDGEFRRWNDGNLNGADRDVVLVSRAVGSGTRDTFEHRVLVRPGRAPISSNDCLVRDIPGEQNGVVHCAVASTEKMIEKVRQTSGAIGYASVSGAEALNDEGVDIIPIDGIYPEKNAVANGTYRFWAVEKLFRYGLERPPTVRDHFVRFVLSQKSALDVLQEHGFYSCNDPAFLDGDVALACVRQVEPATSPGVTPGASPAATSTPSGESR